MVNDSQTWQALRVRDLLTIHTIILLLNMIFILFYFVEILSTIKLH